MFFKKQPPKPEAPEPEYNLEIDKLQDQLGIFVNLKVLEDQGFKVISIERERMNKPDETTVVYTLKDASIEEQNFGISRAQHIQLISDWKNQ